ncbi:MAG: thiamine-phosphate kinase [Planctomycetota bacterium]
MHEFEYIKWIQKQIKRPKSVLVGSGDDAAVIQLIPPFPPKKRLMLVTTDMIVEGIDFSLPEVNSGQARRKPHLSQSTSGLDIGWKALAVSLSDIAAMGGATEYLYAVAAVALRPKVSSRFAREVFRGMKKVADRFSVAIVGGDVSAVNGPMSITTTVFGLGRRLRPLTRSGAKVGDAIMVTGQLGGSILGKHLNFTPRLKEAGQLNQKYRINSMIDISDGLLADLNHLLEQSQMGGILFENLIPISSAARQLSRRTKKPPLFHALADGEDFELLFTMPQKEANRLLKSNNLKVLISHIGQICPGKNIRLVDLAGRLRKIKPKGYEHQL